MNIRKDELKRIIESAFRSGMNYGYGVDHEKIHEYENYFWKEYSESLELFKTKIKNNIAKNLLKLSTEVLFEKKERRKRLGFETPTCSACEHWQGDINVWEGYCPILNDDTDSDESCNDFEDIKDIKE